MQPGTRIFTRAAAFTGGVIDRGRSALARACLALGMAARGAAGMVGAPALSLWPSPAPMDRR
jgi:hypothetical protein